MKDYSLNKLERKEFIKKYKIKKDKIIIYYATGEKFEIIYTPENEKKIIEKMRDQAYQEYKTDKKEKKARDNKLIWEIVLLGSAGIVFLISGISIFESDFVSLKMALGFGSIPCAISSLNVIKNGLLVRDIEKTKFFIENEVLLNKEIDNESVLKNSVGKKTVKKVFRKLNNYPVIDINDIDSMSLNDLVQLKNNIDHCLNLKLEDREVTKKGSKVLTRK